MPNVAVYSKDGKAAGKLELAKEIFAGPVNTAVLYQAVVKYRASARQGTVNTKERAQVSGGGKKPYRQKGTGQARAGSNRSPLWIGGGTTFGPHPRDFAYSIPRKVRQAALRESLNAKFKAGDLVGLAELKEPLAKTKEFAAILKALNRRGKILALLDGCDESVRRVSRNIPRFETRRAGDVNAFDILNSKTLLMTKTAYENLLKRIGA